MSGNIDSLVLEHLRHIRGKVDGISEDVQDIKLRLSSLEMSVSRIKHEFSAVDETNARQQVLIDRLSERLQRIEARLELISIGGQNG